MTDKTEPALERAQFPILGSRGATIDLQLVKDHGKQAQDNHRQTVERLAARGGLSWCELHAVLHDHKWETVDENTAIIECRAIESRYLAATLAPSGDEVERVARAICRANASCRPRQLSTDAIETQVEHAWDLWTDEAKAAIAALKGTPA